MLGKPLASVIGTPMLDYIADPLKREFSELFDTGWAADVRRESQFSIDGRQIPVKLSVNALQMDAGPALNIIITDLTQQKESERELMEKNKMLKLVNDALAQSNYDLQQFASVASHDLQEPLRKIQVFSKFLMDKNLDPMSEASREYIEKIFSSSNRMKALIIDILAYSRLSAIDSNVEQVELRELLEDIIDDFDLRIAEQNAIVELRDLPVVEANRGQFRQVFNNLLSNALKFTQPGSQPHIIISNRIVKAEDVGPLPGAPEDYYNISFRDNGIGFNEKFAATIFTLFEKLHPKSAFEGSGIGLAIAKKIVEKHQGRILAHSQEGMGAEFNIILPRLRTLGN
jgi:signal transduction histidine kinase